MFDESFRVCFADTPFGVALHKRIRFQVFSLDRGTNDPSAFSTAREQDQWDHHSAHFIVQSKNSGKWLAATRLILPQANVLLPVDVHGAIKRDELADPGLRLAEISRFCIISNRSALELGDDTHLDPRSPEAWDIGAIGKKQQYEVTLGMIRAVGIFALKRDIDNCVMLVNDAFARMLGIMGVKLRKIGPNLEHRGMRAPYLVDMRESVFSMAKKSSAMKNFFRRSRQAYVRISLVARDETVDCVSEYAPDHSLFNETIFRETVLLPAEQDSGLQIAPNTNESVINPRS